MVVGHTSPLLPPPIGPDDLAPLHSRHSPSCFSFTSLCRELRCSPHPHPHPHPSSLGRSVNEYSVLRTAGSLNFPPDSLPSPSSAPLGVLPALPSHLILFAGALADSAATRRASPLRAAASSRASLLATLWLSGRGQLHFYSPQTWPTPSEFQGLSGTQPVSSRSDFRLVVRMTHSV